MCFPISSKPREPVCLRLKNPIKNQEIIQCPLPEWVTGFISEEGLYEAFSTHLVARLYDETCFKHCLMPKGRQQAASFKAIMRKNK